MNSLSKSNKSFAKDFFGKGYFFLSLALSAIIATALLVGYSYEIFGKFTDKEGFFIFIMIALGIIGAMLLVYVFASAFSKKVTVGDSISLSMITVGILFAVYVIINEYFDVLSIVVPCALFALGLLAFIISCVRYDKNYVEDANVVYEKNTPVNYVKAVIGKYSFLSVIFVTALISAFAYVFFNGGVRNIFLDAAAAQFAVYVYGIAAAAFTLLFVIFGIISRRINLADVFLIGAFFALVISFFQIYFVLGANVNKLIELAIAAGVWLVLFIIRLFTFDTKRLYIAPAHKGYFRIIV